MSTATSESTVPMRTSKKAPKYFSADEEAARRALVKFVPLTCERCNAKFDAPVDSVPAESLTYYYNLRNPPVIFGLCPRCKVKDELIARARLVRREVVCEECGRRFIADLLSTDRRTSVAECAACSRSESRPKEGETFVGLRRVNDRYTGQFASLASQREYREIEKHLDYVGSLKAKNGNSLVREEIYTSDFVRDAQTQLAKRPLREVAREMKTNWGMSYETVRQGRISVMRLKPSDLEIPPAQDPRPITHKKPRKCEHGMWMHKDDRTKSRHCSACYPNIHAHLIDWKNTKSDAEVVALYESGLSVVAIAERLHIMQKNVRAILIFNEVELRTEDRLLGKTPPAPRKNDATTQWNRVVESNQPEVFGVVPHDPQNLVSEEVA